MSRIGLIASLAGVFVWLMAGGTGWAQMEKSREKVRDGVFEITLKSPDQRKMTVDELVRDRDLDPSALYRVKTGGYLAFDESEWVEKIEFRVFDKPVTDLSEYKKFSQLLVEINRKIWDLKDMLGRYDLLALRMMNICDRRRFATLQSIDDNILQQLTVYRQLILLRSMVVNSLTQFVQQRSCLDKFADYNKTLRLYSKQLDTIAGSYDRLSKRAMGLSDEVQAARDGRKGPKTGESEEDGTPPLSTNSTN